jgi:hypothetical protein
MPQVHLLVVAAVVALAPGSCTDSAVAPQSVGRFRFHDPAHSEFVRLEVRDLATVVQAESLLRSGQARWATGRPRRGDGGFNAPWHWHLDPATVAFAEITIEACQTWPSGVEQDLDYWIGFGQVCLLGIIEARES